MKCRLFHKWRLDPFIPFPGMDIRLQCKRCGKGKIEFFTDHKSYTKARQYYELEECFDKVYERK